MKQNSKRSGKPRGRRKNGNSKNYNKKDQVNTKFEGKSISREEDAREDVRTSNDNDPAWYGVSGQLVDDTARLSFNHPAGIPHTVIPYSNQFTEDVINKEDIPGIMALTTLYGPGVSRNNSSPINLAAKNIYTFVRHVNSGAANYEAPDLMIYIMSIASCLALYAELVRVYGVCRTYKQSNMYLPSSLVYSMGFDYKSIVSDLPRFRSIINVFVRKIGSRPIPGNLNIISRWTWAFVNLFTDTSSNKAQLYLYKPVGHYYYDEETYSADYTGGKCVFSRHSVLPRVARGSTGSETYSHWNLDDIEAVCEFMANQILGSEDLGIMSGDIVKAYGSNIYMLSEITDDFTIEPTYSPEVLTQIHNANIVGNALWTSCDIKQDPSLGFGPLIWAPMSDIALETTADTGAIVDARVAWSYQNYPLDMWQDVPSPNDVMVATRLTGSWDSSTAPYHKGGTQNSRMYFRGGTEFVTDCTVYRLNQMGNLEIRSMVGDQFLDRSYNPANGHSPISAVVNAEVLSKFDWHPHVRYWTLDAQHDVPGVGSKFEGRYDIGEIDNVVYVSPELLDRMDRTAVLSLWDVPETAFYKG